MAITQILLAMMAEENLFEYDFVALRFRVTVTLMKNSPEKAKNPFWPFCKFNMRIKRISMQF